MNTPNLGELIAGPNVPRDAIHIAVAPVTADETLRPGQGVAFRARSTTRVGAYGTTIGIVDPFLTAPVETGQRFWMFLYPNTITALRHDWTHPAFGQEARPFVPAGASDSERWIREYAQSIGVDYYDLMDGADEWVLSWEQGNKWGEYFVQGGTLEGVSTNPEFWPHYEAVRGKKVPEEHKKSFFSCSCG